jgi:hypothetical protein
MPIYEYECPIHGKFEKILMGQFDQTSVPCPFSDPINYEGQLEKCWHRGRLVEFSVPAKRNPRHGEG